MMRLIEMSLENPARFVVNSENPALQKADTEWNSESQRARNGSSPGVYQRMNRRTVPIASTSEEHGFTTQFQERLAEPAHSPPYPGRRDGYPDAG